MPTFNKKTPDVYIEEVSLFPPSVAEVETAIPAFIGYTKETKFNGKELKNIPTAIDSMVEFEERFGGAPPVKIESISLDATNAVKEAEIESTYLLYDSLRLFFQNGGGKCYIIAVGNYTEEISKGAFEAGLAALQKEDEPTLIVFPDAVLLDGTDLYDLQKAALAQANKLQDRFVVMDLREASGWEAGIEDFRNNIGINYLKYGAAYTPHLRANLSKVVRFRDVKGKLSKLGVDTTLKSISEDDDIDRKIANLEFAVEDVDKVAEDLGTTADEIDDGFEAFDKAYNEKAADFRNDVSTPGSDIGNLRGKFVELFDTIYEKTKATVDAWAKDGGSLVHQGYEDSVKVVRDLISVPLKSIYAKLNAYSTQLDTQIGGAEKELYLKPSNQLEAAEWDWAGITTNVTADNSIYETTFEANDDDEAKQKKRMKAAEPAITAVFEALSDAIRSAFDSLATQERTLDSELAEEFPVYKTIVAAVGEELTTLPPSGAIVGVYAAVDANRGVWKAPANYSLAGVADLTQKIDNEAQESLNVDVVAGKSINAIRAFTGRGRLVWGARTLAGNDKEWRYIPVRRFFNMVEESVKKSTNWAVFEPNNANLWIKVRAMIENYLVLKWRDGALQGAAPQDAFFVNVGLGQTMTYQNVLDGYLIVEIGMAVVRPAEFIILRFSHKMVEV